ncbi:MAG TPA: hypothetical protein PK152_17945 [Anaerolineales bacterium]|nr:hypothetical protein [Anaerolineales bacterium]
MNLPEREKRDWSLIAFVVPIGILLIMIVGQIAVRIVPIWSVNAGMNSNLDPDSEAAQPISLIPPLLPQILTPMAWAESYLTPVGSISFPPFIIIEPTATASPSPTPVEPTETPVTPTATTITPTATTPSPSATSPTPTQTDPPDPTETQPTPTQPTPTQPTPTEPTPTEPTPTQPTPTEPTPTEEPGITSTPPAGTPAPVPAEIGVGEPPDNIGPGDENIGVITQGTYIVIQLSIVVGVPDGNYDLVFYEYNNGGSVYLDQIIIGITNDPTGGSYYEVFYWGDGDPDNNSNVGDIAGAEDDNQPIDTDELYDPDGDGPLPQTGILIDVDNAPSNPPSNTYQYIVVIAPPGSDEAQMDAIQAVEVPIPTAGGGSITTEQESNSDPPVENEPPPETPEEEAPAETPNP